MCKLEIANNKIFKSSMVVGSVLLICKPNGPVPLLLLKESIDFKQNRLFLSAANGRST